MTVFRISADPTDYGPDCTDGRACAEALKQAVEGYIEHAGLDCEVELVPDLVSFSCKSTGHPGVLAEICDWLEPRWQNFLPDEKKPSIHLSAIKMLWEIWAGLTDDDAETIVSCIDMLCTYLTEEEKASMTEPK